MKQINIEDEVWRSSSVTKLGGVTIHKGAVVGASSLVNKSLSPSTFCAGNPCKPVKHIFSNNDLKDHLTQLGYTPKTAQSTIEI